MQVPYQIPAGLEPFDVQGIQVYVVEAGDGAFPEPQHTVKIQYHGMLTDGTVFDSSFDRGEVHDFPLPRLIPGWQLALPKVRIGSKVRLVVPPQLGYGSRRIGNIPANSTLLFDIELIDSY